MDTTQQSVITLLRSAVTGKALPLPEDFDLQKVVPFARRHQMVPLIYEGAVLCGVESPLMSKFFAGYCKAIQIHEGQMSLLGRILEAFEEAGVDYMPLKGCKMKALYPKPELRIMGDADVLIRLEQYDRIVPILEQLGLTQIDDTDHELVWENQSLNLELHKRLIPSYNKDFFAYFGDGWQLAKQNNGHCFRMKPEDEWIYELTHFAKHFRDGGIGCRHVVDLWMYQRANPKLDEAYLEQELQKLQLWDFHRNICALIRYWFEDGQADEITEIIGQYILASGSWGAIENRVRSLTVRDAQHAAPGVSGKLVYILKKLFPPCNVLKKKYTVLQKAPWLLPVIWLVRPFYKVLFERKSLDKQKREMDALNKEDLDEHHQMLRRMGIDYNF